MVIFLHGDGGLGVDQANKQTLVDLRNVEQGTKQPLAC